MEKPPITLLGIQAGAGGGTAGAEDGPYVLREAGLVERLRAHGREVVDLGEIPGVYETRFSVGRGQAVNDLRNIMQVNRHTHACVLGALRKTPGAFMLIVGGDHSLAIGALAGLSDASERLGVLWIDAHPDFNTPASSPSGNIHGMSLAVACGRGHRDLRMIADRDPMIEEADVYILGARDIDPEELEELEESEVTLVSTPTLRERGVTRTAMHAAQTLAQRCDHIHLSFDIDVLDPALVPGTGTPVAGGLALGEALDLLRALGASGLIRSAEFVEFNPNLDPDGGTCEVVLQLLDALLAPPAA